MREDRPDVIPARINRTDHFRIDEPRACRDQGTMPPLKVRRASRGVSCVARVEIIRVKAALQPNPFIGCNMTPLFTVCHSRRKAGIGFHLDTKRILFQLQEPAMTQSQRLKYSILISLVVLGIMFGLSYLQNQGVISEKLFQYIAIGVAVIVVVVNGVMRRKVKP